MGTAWPAVFTMCLESGPIKTSLKRGAEWPVIWGVPVSLFIRKMLLCSPVPVALALGP